MRRPSPYSTLVLTAGISAFTPRNILGRRFREKGSPLQFPDGKQNPEQVDPGLSAGQCSVACREWAAAVENHHPGPPDTEISAEFSLLHAIATHGRGLSKGALVHLLHTPTLGGQLAVELQKSLLEARLGVHCHSVKLMVPFDPAQPGGLALASGAFIGQISGLLRSHDPNSTAFAPIGGYKSMVALGHIAASFCGFPSLYLHEDSQVLQEIAAVPIAIAPEVKASVAPVARKVGNGAQWTDLSANQRLIIERHPSFFTRVEDLVELNELGQFLRLDDLPIQLSPAALAAFQAQPGPLRTQLQQIRDLARTNPDHPGINHDLVGIHGRTPAWRLAQMGRGVRIAWQIHGDQILINRIWRDHDDYEKEAKTHITLPLPASFADWQPLT